MKMNQIYKVRKDLRSAENEKEAITHFYRGKEIPSKVQTDLKLLDKKIERLYREFDDLSNT